MFITTSFFVFSFFSSQKVVPPAPLDPKGPWYPKLWIPRAKSDAFHTQAWYNNLTEIPHKISIHRQIRVPDAIDLEKTACKYIQLYVIRPLSLRYYPSCQDYPGYPGSSLSRVTWQVCTMFKGLKKFEYSY